jgi:hypothetical protein
MFISISIVIIVTNIFGDFIGYFAHKIPNSLQ